VTGSALREAAGRGFITKGETVLSTPDRSGIGLSTNHFPSRVEHMLINHRVIVVFDSLYSILQQFLEGYGPMSV
jgi:hypothetical protein